MPSLAAAMPIVASSTLGMRGVPWLSSAYKHEGKACVNSFPAHSPHAMISLLPTHSTTAHCGLCTAHRPLLTRQA